MILESDMFYNIIWYKYADFKSDAMNIFLILLFNQDFNI